MEDLIINGAVILDVRSKSEFSSGHVKGSVNVPLDQLDEYTKKLKTLSGVQLYLDVCQFAN